jgi:hypothetical protein
VRRFEPWEGTGRKGRHKALVTLAATYGHAWHFLGGAVSDHASSFGK